MWGRFWLIGRVEPVAWRRLGRVAVVLVVGTSLGCFVSLWLGIRKGPRRFGGASFGLS